MAWRVILRTSYQKDVGSALRNQIEPALTDAGIVNIPTGIWRNDAADPAQAAQALSTAFAAIATSNVDLDHLWLCIENFDDEVAATE